MIHVMRQPNRVNRGLMFGWVLHDRRLTVAVVWASLLHFAGCGEHPAALSGAGAPWPDAETAFHQEPLWLGADGAYSCPLGGDRVLWLFGDTFVGLGTPTSRDDARMPRNTLAIQTGLDMPTAAMAFRWRTGADGMPSSFLPEDGDYWYWPAGCVRLPEGPLAIFTSKLRRTDGGLGFEGVGWKVAVVANPDDEPLDWQFAWHTPPTQDFDANPGTAVALYDEGGQTYVAMLAAEDSPKHPGRVARILTADLAAGALEKVEWWQNDVWVPVPNLKSAPTIVIDEAGPEASWHYDAAHGLWVHIFSAGFGASTVELRNAPTLTGPWSDSTTVYVPPENEMANPFVYAAKAHPELAGPTESPDALVITYATGAFDFGDLFTDEGKTRRGWPKVIYVPLVRR